MNAITFLIKEHSRIRQMFKEIKTGSHRESTKEQMFNDLCAYLIRHEKMEQKLWYPRLKKTEKFDIVIKHLISEEKSAEKTIKEFKKIKTEKEWTKKFLEFKKDVEHHATEEETRLFPRVEKTLSEKTLEEIGREMRDFEKEYKKSFIKSWFSKAA